MYWIKFIELSSERHSTMANKCELRYGDKIHQLPLFPGYCFKGECTPSTGQRTTNRYRCSDTNLCRFIDLLHFSLCHESDFSYENKPLSASFSYVLFFGLLETLSLQKRKKISIYIFSELSLRSAVVTQFMPCHGIKLRKIETYREIYEINYFKEKTKPF